MLEQQAPQKLRSVGRICCSNTELVNSKTSFRCLLFFCSLYLIHMQNVSSKHKFLYVFLASFVVVVILLFSSPYEQPWLVPIVIALVSIALFTTTTILLSMLRIKIKTSKVVVIFFILGVLFALHTIRQLTLADVMLVAGAVLIVNFYLKGR